MTLRETNADLRLSELGHEIGLLPDERYETVTKRKESLEGLLSELKRSRIGPTDPINRKLAAQGSPPLSSNGASLFDLLRRPRVRLVDLVEVDGLHSHVALEAEIEGKYSGYLAQQEREIERLRAMEAFTIPDGFDYASLDGVSFEGRDLLGRVRPRSFGQASRVPGVSQADLSMLAIHLRR